MKVNFAALLAAFVLFFAASPALAQEPLTAEDMTARCKLTASVDAPHTARMTDGRYDRYWTGTGGTLTVTLPAGAPCQGVALSFFKEAVPLLIEAQDATGAWNAIATSAGRYLNDFVPFAASQAFRLRAADATATLKLSALAVYGEGTLPTSVQRWQTLEQDAELMLVCTHPDDDLIWFGGLLPTYAGEQNKRVMVVYVAGEPSGQRKNELLDRLWTCGVRYYPEIGPFRDLNGKKPEVVQKKWGGAEAVPTYLTTLLRKYRPQVVVTQDIKGEYGHTQHVVMVAAVISAVTQDAADSAYDPASVHLYGVWQPKKLYLHMWRENEITFDWNQPLSAFGGKSGCEVAAEAFKKHISQQKTHYHIYMNGPYDSQRLGLYWSSVGQDEAKTDLFEHVSPAQ